MNFHILTLFPEMVMGGLNTSITGRAIDKGLISVEAVNIRDYSKDKHHHSLLPACLYIHTRNLHCLQNMALR